MVITNFRLYENKQKAESIIKKLNIPNDNDDYQKIKELTEKRPNYFGQFVKWFFVDKASFGTLEDLMTLLVKDKIKLDRPIDTFDKGEQLYDYLTKYKFDTKVEQIIKKLPSKARRNVSDELRNLLRQNLRWSKNIMKHFSNVGGRYNPDGELNLTPEDMYNSIKIFIDNLSGGFNADAYKSKIENKNLNIDIVNETGDLLVMCVNDYESAQQIGSQDWCIVTSKNHWDDYVNDFTKQYFIFDFSKKEGDRECAIGVTVSVNFGSEPNKFTAIHWSNDDTDGLSKEYIDELGKKHGIK